MSLIIEDVVSWYVARIQPGKTATAIASLKKENVSHIYPTFKDLSGKEFPITAGYVFVQSSFDKSEFAFLNGLRGIDRLLPFGTETPYPVRDTWMEDFQEQLVNGSYDIKVEQEEPLPWFKKNEILRIISGPFINNNCTFTRVRKGAVEVELLFFGRQMTVQLRGHQVKQLN